MILVIPDIHFELNNFNKIIRKYSHIKNKVSLGDWYDSHEDKYKSVEHVSETARLHRDFIKNPDHICLFGNHDMQYAFPQVAGFGCSGWDPWKQMPIDQYMKDAWKDVKLFHWVTINKKEWLLSHAGFHTNFSPITQNHLTTICNDALYSAVFEGRIKDILSVGRYRGGYHPHGGCTWMDFDDFKPTNGINQIVGHSHGSFVRSKNTPTSENYCIDASNSKGEYLGYVALITDDGKCLIEEV
jgi:predicted phosphodiesterase